MHALSRNAAGGIAGADIRQPMSAMAALGVWLGLSLVGWGAVAAVVASLV
jgi:hypothetical protein